MGRCVAWVCRQCLAGIDFVSQFSLVQRNAHDPGTRSASWPVPSILHPILAAVGNGSRGNTVSLISCLPARLPRHADSGAYCFERYAGANLNHFGGARGILQTGNSLSLSCTTELPTWMDLTITSTCFIVVLGHGGQVSPTSIQAQHTFTSKIKAAAFAVHQGQGDPRVALFGREGCCDQ